MLALQTGANAPLHNNKFSLKVKTPVPKRWLEYAGIVLLPIDDKRKVSGQAIYAHLGDSKIADTTLEEDGTMRWSLDLSELANTASKALLTLYSYQGAGPLLGLQQVDFIINDQTDNAIEYKLNLDNNNSYSMLCLEFYQRNDQWKVRALAEGSTATLNQLGKNLNAELDAAPPGGQAAGGHAGGHANGHIGAPVRRPGETWSGSGFTIGAQHIMTCAHVTDGATQITVSTNGQRYSAEVVCADYCNDIALMAIKDANNLPPLGFRDTMGVVHGEDATTLGYPLSSVMGSLQITQGCVSGVFGPRNDASSFQITAPIQPGSSGSPVLDANGRVIGMVTSSLRDSQNINFAVKLAMMSAFLDAVEVPTPFTTTNRRRSSNMSATDMVSATKNSIWQLECRS